MKLKISRLVAKLLGHRNFKCINGNLLIWGVPMFFYPSKILPRLFHDSKNCKKCARVLYYAGKIQSFNGTNVLIKRFGMKPSQRKTFLQMFVDQGIMLGIANGKFNLKGLKDAHITFEADSFFAEEYKKLFGTQKEAICHYLRGLICGGMEAIFDKGMKFEVIEKKCIAKGDSSCVFEAKPATEWSKNRIPKSQLMLEPEYYKKIKTIETLNRLLKVEQHAETMIYDQKGLLNVSDIKYYNSKFFLKGIEGSLMPMDTFILICKSLEQEFNKKDYIDILLNLARIQSNEMLTKIMVDKELKRTEGVLQQILSPITLSGFGYVKIISLDFKKNKFIISVDNRFAKNYVKLFFLQKEPIDFYVRGLIKGCLEYYLKTKFDVTETNCIALGKDSCIFEAKGI